MTDRHTPASASAATPYDLADIAKKLRLNHETIAHRTLAEAFLQAVDQLANYEKAMYDAWFAAGQALARKDHIIEQRQHEIGQLVAVAGAAFAYRSAEQDGTPRMWKGKELCDLSDALDKALETAGFVT